MKKMPPNNQTEDNGHFGTGFLVGSLLGAVGMYLFGTPQGKKTIEQIKKEFQAVEEEMNTVQQENIVDQIKVPIAHLEEKTKKVTASAANLNFPKFKKKSK